MATESVLKSPGLQIERRKATQIALSLVIGIFLIILLIFFPNIVISGTSLALVLSLISLGYALVYGVGKVINLSHGMFYFLAGYLVFVFTEYMGLALPLGITLSLVIITGIGSITYLALIKPFHESEVMVLIATFALGYFIFNLVLLTENIVNLNVIPGFIYLQQFIPGAINLFGVQFTFYRMFVMIMSVVVIIAVILFIRYSRFGKAVRAVSQDQDAARLMGINLDGVLLFTVTLAAFLAGVAAFLYVPLEPMDMATGWDILLLSMSVVILGGMGSIPGTVIGAFILSFSVRFCEAFLNPLVGFQISTVIHLIVIIIMLMIRPQGILGKKEKI
ncbi:MAG: branched-chain amino acid ABC transporter permease [Candidatus Thorarchaeota archaeon]